jgi:hypothetical protein
VCKQEVAVACEAFLRVARQCVTAKAPDPSSQGTRCVGGLLLAHLRVPQGTQGGGRGAHRRLPPDAGLGVLGGPDACLHFQGINVDSRGHCKR